MTRLSIDLNADFTSLLPSPNTYKKKISLSHVFPEMAQTYERREQRTENSLSDTVLLEGKGYDRGNKK